MSGAFALAVAGAVLLLLVLIKADAFYMQHEQQHARQQVTRSLSHACKVNTEFC